MKVLDALLMKLGEEFAELSSAAGTAGQLTSKAVRFGLDSHHPDDLNKISNAALIEGAMSSVVAELSDVMVFNWLITFYCCHGAIELPVPPFLTGSAAALSQALITLDRYMRYSDVMVKTGSMTSAEHAELITCVSAAKGHLTSLMKEPFVL